VRAEQLTVVIPTRGRWDVLPRTLDALAAQREQGFDVVVIVNGLEERVPRALRDRPGVRFVIKADEGPGVSRNVGVALAERELLLFLGDDTLPEPDLLSAHLQAHTAEPAPEIAVLGHVDWHPEVARGRVNRWLEWSGSQFDYRQLLREHAAGVRDAGFGRLYASNLSMKRAFFQSVGGFDPAFRFGYEDTDFGWRAAQQGMQLRYEPAARALHLHAHDLPGVQRRFQDVGAAERLMVAKHDWFEPWFRERITRHAAAPAVSALWPAIVDLIPESIERLHYPVRERADRWYHQQLAAGFLEGWDRQLDREELEAYLGDRFELERLWRHSALLDAEAAATGDEARFYRTSEAYLYDLTAFAMTGTKDPYRAQLRALLAPGARLLDYGCGIGTDGLRLLQAGYRVEFADFDNPSVAYLRWRLARRGLSAPIHDLDGAVPGGFDAAYAFDVIEHVDDPFAFLAELESRAAIVMVNLLEPAPGETPLHRPLPIRALLAHATRRGLLRYRRYYGRSHLIAYRGTALGQDRSAAPGRDRGAGPPARRTFELRTAARFPNVYSKFERAFGRRRS
jgi:glycosyltransferase involved in cell wall biosynthesis